MDVGEKAAEVSIGRMKEERSPFTKFKEERLWFFRWERTCYEPTNTLAVYMRRTYSC